MGFISERKWIAIILVAFLPLLSPIALAEAGYDPNLDLTNIANPNSPLFILSPLSPLNPNNIEQSNSGVHSSDGRAGSINPLRSLIDWVRLRGTASPHPVAETQGTESSEAYASPYPDFDSTRQAVCAETGLENKVQAQPHIKDLRDLDQGPRITTGPFLEKLYKIHRCDGKQASVCEPNPIEIILTRFHSMGYDSLHVDTVVREQDLLYLDLISHQAKRAPLGGIDVFLHISGPNGERIDPAFHCLAETGTWELGRER